MLVGSTVYFTAYDRQHGLELWKTDGTSSGTVLVKDINPGHGDGIKSNLVVANGIVFFTADDGTRSDPSYGGALWKSDGTADGTRLVVGILPEELTNVNGTLFFVRGDSELWKSDGTAAGTVHVTDVANLGCDSKELGPSLTAGKDQLFFLAEGLWRSD